MYLMNGDTFPKVGWLNVDVTQADYHFEDWVETFPSIKILTAMG